MVVVICGIHLKDSAMKHHPWGEIRLECNAVTDQPSLVIRLNFNDKGYLVEIPVNEDQSIDPDKMSSALVRLAGIIS